MPSSGRRHGDVTDRDLSFDPGTADMALVRRVGIAVHAAPNSHYVAWKAKVITKLRVAPGSRR